MLWKKAFLRLIKTADAVYSKKKKLGENVQIFRNCGQFKSSKKKELTMADLSCIMSQISRVKVKAIKFTQAQR